MLWTVIQYLHRSSGWRFPLFSKREHKLDTTLLLKGYVTGRRTRKEQALPGYSDWRVGAEAFTN